MSRRRHGKSSILRMLRRLLAPASDDALLVSQSWPPRFSSVRAVRRTLAAVRPGDDTLALLASELAANAVEHAQGWFRVELHANATGLRLIVFDQGSVSLPSRGHAFADPLAERGRGLLLVQNLASAWGVTPLDGGKAVWLDLPRSGASSQGPPLLV